jgi:DNA-directed RNA polymerase subunit RPC12/RpoP
MCKYHEIKETNEIECDYCGKRYRKKEYPKSQMMAHMKYCPNKQH